MYSKDRIKSHIINIKRIEERALKTYEELVSVYEEGTNKKLLEDIAKDERRHKRLLEEALALLK